jgi:hypothetical protein
MLLSLTVALLAVAPAAPRHVSLLASDAPTLPASARVLTQAPTEAAPIPASPELEAHMQDVLQQIRALNQRIDAVNTDWPGSSTFMVALGVLLGGVTAVFLPLAVLTNAFGSQNNSLLPFLGTGLGSVVLLVVGYVTGSAATEPAEREREGLVRERDALRLKLQELKAQRQREQGLTERPVLHVPLLSLAF